MKAIIGTILSLEDIVTSFCHCVYFMKHCVLLHADFLFQEMVTGLYIVHIQIVANNDVCNLLLANNDVCMYVPESNYIKIQIELLSYWLLPC